VRASQQLFWPSSGKRSSPRIVPSLLFGSRSAAQTFLVFVRIHVSSNQEPGSPGLVDPAPMLSRWRLNSHSVARLRKRFHRAPRFLRLVKNRFICQKLWIGWKPDTDRPCGPPSPATHISQPRELPAPRPSGIPAKRCLFHRHFPPADFAPMVHPEQSFTKLHKSFLFD